MKTELAPAQIENYQKEGWLIVDDFLAPEELRALNTAVDTGVETMGGNKVSGEHNESIKDDSQTYYNRVFLQRVNLWRVNDDIKNFFLNPTLGEMLCQLADINGIRVWHDQTLQKPAWGNPTSWHMDVPNWSFHSPNAISIWIALNDATVQNGCMYFLPGSHQQADYERKGRFRRFPQWTHGPRRRSQYDAICPPGDDLRLYARWRDLQRHPEYSVKRVL